MFKTSVVIAAIVFFAASNGTSYAEDLHPRFKNLLQSIDDTQGGRLPCPHVNTRTPLTEMVPSSIFRKSLNSETEYTILRYYPMYSLITLTVHTSGERFENQCREAAVSLETKTGTIDSGLFVRCPGNDPNEVVELYGMDKDKNLVGEKLMPVWQQRADEFLAEVESIAKMCKHL